MGSGGGWDEYLMSIALAVAAKSKDPSTKVGAVIVDRLRLVRATGFNGLPRRVEDRLDRLNDRETKLRMVVHAEMNAICAAARVGVPLDGCSLYVTLQPCSRCAGLIIQTGIAEVVHPDTPIPERWADDFRHSDELMREAGIEVRRLGAAAAGTPPQPP